MKFSIHPNAKSKDPIVRDKTWEELVLDLSEDQTDVVNASTHGDYKAYRRDHCPCFSICDRSGPLRGANVLEIEAYVWDLDSEGHRIGELLESLDCYYAYESMSSTPDQPRWRVIVPLSRPVESAAWHTFWTTCDRIHGSLNDPAVKDPTRLYYSPHLGAKTLSKDGPRLDVDQIMALATPVEVTGQESYPITDLDFLALSSKLEGSKDELPKITGRALRDVAQGRSYAEAGERDTMLFHMCNALVKAHPLLDVEACAKVFDPVHEAWGGDQVEQRAQRVREKLERLQRSKLGMPTAKGLVLHDKSQHVVAGRVLAELAPMGLINDQLHQYERGVWKLMNDRSIYRGLERFVDSYVVSSKSLYQLDSTTYEGVAKCMELRAEPGPAQTPGLCFGNGFMTLPDQVMHEHDPKYGSRNKLPYDYDPGSSFDEWAKVLEDVFPGQPRSAMCLAEFVGACLAGIPTDYDRCVVFLGPDGQNGKSTIQNVIKTMFDRSKVTAIPPQRWSNDYYKVDLFDSAINVVAELPKATLFASETFKDVISGGEITGRPIRQMPKKGCPTAGHLFAANTLFETKDSTLAFFRRFIILTFDARFDGKTTRGEILERVRGPGLYNWALEGLGRLIKNGEYTIPECHQREIDQWRFQSDPVAEWLKDRTGPGAATSSDLYADFERWFMAEYQETPMSQRKFAIALPFRRTSSGGRSVYPVEIK